MDEDIPACLKCSEPCVRIDAHWFKSYCAAHEAQANVVKPEIDCVCDACSTARQTLWAKKADVSVEDVIMIDHQPTIDGMLAWDWISAMYEVD